MNFIPLISAVLILLIIILLARYAWGIFFDSNYKPVEWEHACKRGQIGKELSHLERNYPDKVRFFNWWFQVERLKRDGVPGDFAELGVYKGESAKIIHLMDPLRTFHLYDTFEGFKDEDLKDETGEAATYTTRNFADTSLEAVKRYLGGEGRFVFHAGRFERSAVGGRRSAVISQQPDGPDVIKDRGPETGDWRLALVNIDVDLYNPTKAGLDYFYPLLSPGGVIIVHDYTHKWPGIKRAIDEFSRTIPEPLIMVPDMDGSVMIVKSLT